MPVAIVGIGCRFPGAVVDARSFWRLLTEGRNAITEIPTSRIDVEQFFDPRPALRGHMMTRWGGFLDNIEDFDPGFFGISPREAERMDPQQRLLLEVAWEAMEDAGVNVARLKGSRTGVYVGQWLSDFEARLFADTDSIDLQATTGSGRYAASGRISYVFDFRGPSLTIDTACSSSLVAVHQAVAAIRSGECSLALAGGANIILQPHISVAYSQSRMMAPDGHCKFGDAAGDGYVRSEGAALILLKPLAAAQADGDRIYAVVRGSAVNNDGRSSGVMGRPSPVGHEEMLRRAYADAGVAASRVGYLEAHGTGTPVGDPVEIAALGAVLGEGRDPAARCLIGSAKTNIGHTEGAAGVAGLIKAALALHHGAVPASLHFVNPNPQLPWAELPFQVPTALSPWPPSEGPRVAGVSAFGIAGTNAHVVLEATPPALGEAPLRRLPARPALLVLSARSPEALRAVARRYAERLGGASRVTLDDVCWNAATRRTALEHRAAFVAEDAGGMVAQLSAYANGEAAMVEGAIDDVAPVLPVFVAPGQGGQWTGMARALLQREPAFRDALLACEAAAQTYLDASIVRQIEMDPTDAGYRLDKIDVIQPTLVALAIAYARWLESLGIAPTAVVGHSMGEVAAAHLAGVLDLDQAMRIICRRSALMAGTSGQGAMAMVGLPMGDTDRRLAGRQQQLSVAASNSPTSCVVSGDPTALAALMAELEGDGVFCRLVNVDVASHSPQMEPLATALTADLGELAPREAVVPIHSTVLGRPARRSDFDAGYWGRNMVLPVRFDTCVTRLLDDGVRTFIELGPHPVLSGAVQQTAQARGVAVMARAFGRREEPEHGNAMAVIGALWVAGVDLDWRAVLPCGAGVVDLPLYPWQRERCWGDAADQGAPARVGDPARRGHHPLLERRFEPAGQDGHGAMWWETTLAAPRFPYFADHLVRGTVLFPAAAYCEAALAAAAESRATGRWSLRDVEFHAAWALPAGTSPRLQVRLEWSGDDEGRFEIYGLTAEGDGRWERRATGRITASPPQGELVGQPAAAPVTKLSADETYALLASTGLDYGPAFRSLRDIQLTGSQAVAVVELDRGTLDPRAARYHCFPPLLDGVLQAVAVAIAHSSGDDESTPIPTRLSCLELYHQLPSDGRLVVTVNLEPSAADIVSGDADICDIHGQRLGTLKGVGFTRLRPSRDLTSDNTLFEPFWVKTALPPKAATIGPVLVVADAAATARPLIDALAASGLESSSMLARELSTAPAAARLNGLFTGGSAARGHIVYLSGGECPVSDEGVDWIEQAWQRVGDDTLALARAIDRAGFADPPRVWLVTQRGVATGSTDGPRSLGSSALWGLGRVWAHEQPGLDQTLIDLDGGSVADLVGVLRAEPAERQLALRQAQWYALRLTPLRAESAVVDPPSFRVTLASPGEPDSLHWQAASRTIPRPHEVEIEVEHVGVNFMNVMSALGVYPGYESGQGPLGIECAGRIVRVGAAITQLRPGDEVVAIGSDCLRRHALVPGDLVARRPPMVASDVAAGLPIAFLTAWYGLIHLARLERGDRVLIHSAAGGVGLAALQIAQRAGAEIYATAGTEEKRTLLRTLGVRHVFDSRGTGFADAVLESSGGQGVDVVQNALAGEAIAAGLRCLAPYGRFVELGKRDIYGGAAMALAPFRANLSYFAVDLDRMMRERPTQLGPMLRELMQQVDAGEYRPLPTTTFPADDVVGAFKGLMSGSHVGKHVVSLHPEPTKIAALPGFRSTVRGDGCYVITGGLGALGLEVARWLAERGAAAVMLVGRRPPTPAVEATLREIEALGTRVLTAACDVADRAALASALARARLEGGSLRGVFHAAGVLADATLGEMSPATLRLPRDAKVFGAWHLDRLTAEDPLDCFVMFSSVASLFGTPGQGNYAAANAFLDALAHDRRARGVPGLAINFGPVATVGLAAASAVRGGSLRRLGFDSMPAAGVIEALDRLVAVGATQAACTAFEALRWQRTMGRAGAVSLVEPVAEADGPGAAGSPVLLGDALAAVPVGPPRRALIEASIKAEVGAVLRMTPSRVPLERPLKALGLDSLTALELRNRLEKRAGVSLSATLAWNHPSVRALAEHLAERLQVALDPPRAVEVPPVGAATELDALLDDLERMSDEEARALLASEGSA